MLEQCLTDLVARERHAASGMSSSQSIYTYLDVCYSVAIATDDISSGGVSTVLTDDDGEEASTRSVSEREGHWLSHSTPLNTPHLSKESSVRRT